MAVAGNSPDYLIIGEILRPHGVRGEVRMRIMTDYPEHLKRLEHVYLVDSPDEEYPDKLALKNLRFNKEYALLTLEGYSSRNDAELLRRKLVMIGMEQAPPLAEGEYYLFQLIGMTVVADQVTLGRVKEVLQTGANDVYIIESDRYGELLIPAHEETIEVIDFEAEVITMCLPDGLLPSD